VLQVQQDWPLLLQVLLLVLQALLPLLPLCCCLRGSTSGQ
jgi:hypothetical protein